MLSNFKNKIAKGLTSSISKEAYALFEKNQLLLGKIKSDFNIVYADRFSSLNEFEFSVFSQFGEDGIIQYLVNKINLTNRIFVEFGVENYKESNTRFLLMNDNWHGLIIDGSIENIEQIKKSEIYWKYDLQARAEFITKENINEILIKEKIQGDIGLLSIDIDGNDYWVWDAISVIRPQILVIEYNSLFGNKRTITVPYDKDFYRLKYHYSGLVFGASLPSLVDLSDKKGYYFIGCNKMGNNAFFVRRDCGFDLKSVSVEQGYKTAGFRESRSMDGTLSYLRANEKHEAIKGVKVFNTETKQIEFL